MVEKQVRLNSKTEIEISRELLEETEQLLQFGSWTWDIGNHTVTWTAGLYAMLGYEGGTADGNDDLSFFLKHIDDDYRPAFEQLLEGTVRNGSDFSYEFVIRTRAGVPRNISCRARVVKDDLGAAQKVLCINRDITALHTFEKEQERSIRELERSNKDLEEFAYIASHDLQEPLRKISMFTERLKAKYENAFDKEGDLFIERILASAANMRTLIDNLLDFSRANRRSYKFEQIDLKNILDNVVSEFELKIEEAEADISFAGEFHLVEAVPSEMKQLFGNVLSNAIKFRKPDGQVKITITGGRLSKSEKGSLGLPANESFVKVDIQDNGIGFDPEYAEKIFQIFQRLNGKAEYPGSGIGLAICKKIVEKHNGVIFARSQPDRGATFTIILPETK